MSDLFSGKQVVDTLDVLLRYTDRKTGEVFPIATASTTSVDLARKFDKIEVFNGIGNNKKFSLHTKQNTTLKIKIAEFDTEFLARKFGAKLNTKPTTTFKKDVPFAITTNKATVPKALRILDVQDENRNSFSIITNGTPEVGQCMVKPATLPTSTEITFATTYTGKTAVVTYETEISVDTDNAEIKLSSMPELSNCEVLCSGIVFDEESNDVTHDIFINLYSCLMNPDTDLSFAAGKPLEIDVEFDVKAVKKLPSGAFLPKAEIGTMKFSERE